MMDESTLTFRERLKLRLLHLRYRISFACPIGRCDECRRWFWKRESDEFHAPNLFYCSTHCAESAMDAMIHEFNAMPTESFECDCSDTRFLPVSDRSLIASLQSSLCPACAGDKPSCHAFCLTCFRKMPASAMNALYVIPVDQTYEQAFDAALDHLKVSDLYLPATEQHA
jgi:hypothetical protein